MAEASGENTGPSSGGPSNLLERLGRRSRLLLGWAACILGGALALNDWEYAPLLALPVAAAGLWRGSLIGVAAGLLASGARGIPALISQAISHPDMIEAGPGEPAVPVLALVSGTVALCLVGWSGGKVRRERRKHRERLDAVREAREGLQEQRRASRSVIEALPDEIFRLDTRGMVLGFSGSSAGKNVRTKETEYVGRHLLDLFPADAAAELEEAVSEALETMDSVTVEFDWPRDDDNVMSMEARIGVSGSSEAIMVLREVSEMKRLQRQLDDAHQQAVQATSTKSRFLATMSHQIRTPMNGVVGMTNLLLKTPLKTEQREYTSVIRNSGEALLGILDEVLNLSQVEAGRVELEQLEFTLPDCLEEVVELLAARAQDKGLELASLIDTQVPRRVVGDAGRLRQVVTNLLGNAIKFTEKGEVSLHVSLVGQDHESVMIRCDVTDTGMGIAPEIQASLFEDFAQGSRAIARQYGGTGLGLAISRQIVDRMGGRMNLTSTPGRGSTFSFTAKLNSSRDRRPSSVFLPRVISGASVVVLPMHPLLRKVLEHQVRPHGVELLYVDSVAEALEVMGAPDRPDTALMELGPRSRCSLDDLKNLVTGTRHNAAPIGVLCPIGQHAMADAARRAGAALCINRPLKHRKLIEGLSKLLGLSARGASMRPPVMETIAERPPLMARVLVAEDNLLNQTVAQRTLEALGCQAEVVADGLHAVEAAVTGKFDAVLMDCQMPELDGFEAARRIRGREQTGQRIPIIAMTASVMEGDRERCLAADMDDYIPKPVTVDELGSILERWVGGRPDPSASSIPTLPMLDPPD